MSSRDQITKITLSFLKDPANMPKDNTLLAGGEEELELPELPEEEVEEDMPKDKKKKKEESKETDEFQPGKPTKRGGGEPLGSGWSRNDLFKKKTGAY